MYSAGALRFCGLKSTESISNVSNYLGHWIILAGRGARFALSVLKKITMKLLQITTAWLITSCDNSFIAIVTGSYYKLRQVLYTEMMTAITNYDTIITDKITTEHCKKIFFNTNKFLTVTQSVCKPSRSLHHAVTFAVIRDRGLVFMSRIFTLLYDRAVLTDTWVRKASLSLYNYSFKYSWCVNKIRLLLCRFVVLR